jgi:hypothetical protein
MIDRSTCLAAAFALGLPAVSLGCGSDGLKPASHGPLTPGGGKGGASSSSTTTTGQTGGGGSTPGGCGDPAYGGGEKAAMLESCDGDIEDESNAPLPKFLLTLCGLDKCENGQTDAAGHVHWDFANTITKPALKMGDGAVRLEIAALLPVSQAATMPAPIPLPRLPKDGAPIVVGGAATSNGVTLTVAAGSQVGLSDQYPTAEMQQFRAMRVPDGTLAAIQHGETVDIAYGMGPSKAFFCPAAAMAFPNDLGLTPGATVDVYLHGVETMQTFAAYAEWTKVAEATVSADGKTIATGAEAIHQIGVIGLKRR